MIALVKYLNDYQVNQVAHLNKKDTEQARDLGSVKNYESSPVAKSLYKSTITTKWENIY